MNELVAALSRHGVLLVFGNVLLEQLGIPLPAIPTLVLAGALAADGKLPLAGLLFAAVAASLLGDAVWFLLGRWQGHRILKMLCRLTISPDSCVRQTESVFERWGLPALLVAKFIPGLSTVAPPLAGSGRVGMPAFLAWSGAGAFLWAGSGIALGWTFHDAVDRVVNWLATLGGGALTILGGAFVVFLLVKWTQRWRFFRKLRMARIVPDELRRLLSTGEPPAVADVRSALARAGDPRRIPGAFLLTLENFDALVRLLPREREIVLYCT